MPLASPPMRWSAAHLRFLLVIGFVHVLVGGCSNHSFAAHALHLLGDIATCPDRFDSERAEAHYRESLALAEAHGMRPLVAHCHFGLGALYRRTGRSGPAREHLNTARTMYREMDMRFWLENIQ
ncbi:MAG: hypothetical protein DME00_27870 [Candidatus Rokuibacteriota bacterium]|nr:MAG: hypothetical protein DME00_27870 [Candidatus Rokubacteria bacterium]